MGFLRYFFWSWPKETPQTPKKSRFLWVRWNLLLAETFYVVIPKQDTFLCNADRSLSRLRGSPLTGAGCLGPVSRVGLDCLAGRGCSGPSSRVGTVIMTGTATAAWAAGRSWVAVPLGLGWALGLRLAWVCSSGWVLLRRLWPPVRVWVGCAAWALVESIAYIRW